MGSLARGEATVGLVPGGAMTDSKIRDQNLFPFRRGRTFLLSVMAPPSQARWWPTPRHASFRLVVSFTNTVPLAGAPTEDASPTLAAAPGSTAALRTEPEFPALCGPRPLGESCVELAPRPEVLRGSAVSPRVFRTPRLVRERERGAAAWRPGPHVRCETALPFGPEWRHRGRPLRWSRFPAGRTVDKVGGRGTLTAGPTAPGTSAAAEYEHAVRVGAKETQYEESVRDRRNRRSVLHVHQRPDGGVQGRG